MELSSLRDVLKQQGMDEKSLEGFLRLYQQFKKGPAKVTDWESLHSPEPKFLPSHESLPSPAAGSIPGLLSHLVVCKLNGGLGTSMGCKGPKSLLAVKQGKAFLDLIVGQLAELRNEWKTSVPLLLMDSFYTHDDTLNAISRYGSEISIKCFLQNRYPRLDRKTELPLEESKYGREAWYPPGHGDIYACLQHQGWIDRLINEGKTILFVSNADNLGAVVDMRILNHMVEQDIPFIMEMTPKTPMDIKGGTLYEKDGRLHLLEIAQVPEEHIPEFCSTQKFKVFNTNNIWINLPHLQRRLEEGPLKLNLIVNEKTVGDRAVIQLETAIGAGLENFSGSLGLVVGRERFLPVKNTHDLMLVQSDLFILEGSRLRRNPTRKKPELPLVQWDDGFRWVESYLQRIPVPPGLLNLDSLKIEGDVRFEGKVVLEGAVELIAKHRPIRIPAGAVLKDCRIEK